MRSASKEQVESLGGKFLTVDGAEDMETSGGYAKEATEDYKKKQNEMMQDALKKMILLFVLRYTWKTCTKNN